MTLSVGDRESYLGLSRVGSGGRIWPTLEDRSLHIAICPSVIWQIASNLAECIGFNQNRFLLDARVVKSVICWQIALRGFKLSPTQVHSAFSIDIVDSWSVQETTTVCKLKSENTPQDRRVQNVCGALPKTKAMKSAIYREISHTAGEQNSVRQFTQISHNLRHAHGFYNLPLRNLPTFLAICNLRAEAWRS